MLLHILNAKTLSVLPSRQSVLLARASTEAASRLLAHGLCSDLPVQPTKFIPRQPLWLLNGNIIKSIYRYLRELALVLTCIGST